MTRWLIRASVAVVLISGGSAAFDPATAAPRSALQKQQAVEAADLGARRRLPHHHRFTQRQTYRPIYYDRPVGYAPAPFMPFLGLGYGPWW